MQQELQPAWVRQFYSFVVKVLLLSRLSSQHWRKTVYFLSSVAAAA